MKITKAISGIAVALCTLAINITASASETTDLPTHLMNGSFENPAISSSTTGDLSSGSQGAWYLNNSSGYESLSGNGFYWKTTSSDGKMELASTNRGSISGYGVSAPYDGNQFAELVAEEQSSLYQNISTSVSGTVLNWGLSHAGRTTNDTMALFIGPAQNDYTKKTAAGNDIFMWMAELIKETSDIKWSTASVGYTKHTVYSQANIDLSKVTSKNYTEYFSFSKTATINQEWRCWLITDAAGAWGTYSDIYTVPDNQPETTFAFTALTGYANYPTIAGQYNEGNLLDGITFATSFPLRVATTEGGTATVNIGSEKIADVSYDADHIGTYDDGTEIIISATAKEGYHLLGAYINGVFCTPNETGHFTKNDDGSLSHSITMDTARYVQLIFGKEGTLIYDPNGGTYKGTSEDTEITMASTEDIENNIYSAWTNTEDAQPANDKTKFIGWYVGRITHNGVAGGALITSDHTVTYNTGTVTGNTSDDTLDLEYNLVVRGENGVASLDFSDGIVFVAEWEYLQETGVKTKDMEHAHYSDNSAGGKVTQTIKDSDSETYRENGYGRLRDIVTLHVTENEGYRFRGWYDESGNLLSSRNVYEYEVSQPTKIYAYFSELHHPVVSFVSATGNETLEGESTHAKYKGNAVSYALSGIGGENIYGNTISTGFITWQSLDHETVNEHTYGFSQWSITLPAPTEDKPIYIKKTADVTSSDFEFDADFIIEDADGVQANKGNIYKVTGFVNDAESIIINLFNTLPTHVTTEGSIDLIYNITLDNIYAPGAEATLDLKAREEDMLFESINISNDETKYLHSGSLDEYLTDENNEYSNVVETSEVE